MFRSFKKNVSQIGKLHLILVREYSSFFKNAVLRDYFLLWKRLSISQSTVQVSSFILLADSLNIIRMLYLVFFFLQVFLQSEWEVLYLTMTKVRLLHLYYYSTRRWLASQIFACSAITHFWSLVKLIYYSLEVVHSFGQDFSCVYWLHVCGRPYI